MDGMIKGRYKFRWTNPGRNKLGQIAYWFLYPHSRLEAGVRVYPDHWYNRQLLPTRKMRFRWKTLGFSGGCDVLHFPNLTEVEFPNLETGTTSLSAGSGGSGSVIIMENPELLTVRFPKLGRSNYPLIIVDNPKLRTIELPEFVPSSSQYISSWGQWQQFSGNDLDAATVNNILIRAAADPLFNPTDNRQPELDLNGGTNAAPSGAGLAAKNTLVSRGVIVRTN